MNPEKDYLGKLVEPFTYKVSNLLEEVKSLRSRLAEVEKERDSAKDEFVKLRLYDFQDVVKQRNEAREALLAAKAVVEAARRIKESPQINGMLIEDLEICVEAYDAALGRKES